MRRRCILGIVAFLFAVTVSVEAHQSVNATDMKFGRSYTETSVVFRQYWGEPSAEDSMALVYQGREFQGMVFDKVELKFQYDGSGSFFNQARFYKFCPSKAGAIRQMKGLAERLGQFYPVTYDEEDDGTPFYKGGCAPVGMGNLFTIFVAPFGGRWTCQLRYGAFPYVKSRK